MKEFIKNPLNLNKIEFWASTSFYVITVFTLITQAIHGHNYNRQLYNNNIDNYILFMPRFCRYTILYAAFLLLNFQIAPSLVKKQRIWISIIAVVVLFLIVSLTYGITDTYLNSESSAIDPDDFVLQHSLLQSLWLLMMFSFYTFIKHASVYLLKYLDRVDPMYYLISRECMIAFIAWLAVLFILISTHANVSFITVWSFSVPLAIGIYWYSFYRIIPDLKEKKKGFRVYLGRIIFWVFICFFPLSIILAPFEHQALIPINLFNAAFQLLFIAPFTWQIYKYRSDSNAELYRLKTALGQSDANYQFLQSQINPHFLFNALNTLYGTALQENAERTGEGIQRLGDMMRFMLHENVQEAIPLGREIDYLHNYISIQKLRTQTSPDIVIQTEIEDSINGLRITPMLLIPFVENAFKHGISLREPSHIKITLYTKGNTLHFDVYNSVHAKPDNDPEKDYSGIGLNNLKQRLKLVYPQLHELVIHQTAKEFFVHLTLELTGYKQPDK